MQAIVGYQAHVEAEKASKNHQESGQSKNVITTARREARG